MHSLIFLLLAVALVAFLYSSAGHGGASGYLAVLSFFAVAPALMSSTALVLNVIVAGISCMMFARAGLFPVRVTGPFLLGSLPASFLGGMLTVSQAGYFLLLAGVLLAASVRLAFFPSVLAKEDLRKEPPLAGALTLGAAIGLVSGILGIGGGIFLSPLLLIFRWSDARTAAAVASLFIVVNSLSGLAGRIAGGTLHTTMMVPLIAAAVAGGGTGSYFAAKKYSNAALQKILALVLFIAAVKLLLDVR